MNIPTDRHVTLSQDERGLIAHIGGDLSILNATEIHRSLLEAWRDEASGRELIVDLAHVRRIDSSGIGVLLELISDGVPLSLCNLQTSPRRLLERTGLSTFLRVYSDCGEVPAPRQAA